MAADVPRSELFTVSLDETARRGFEDAWRQGRPVPIEMLLPPKDHPHYLATLQELVLIEIEMAWKAAGDDGGTRPCSVETYLQRFPRLNQPAIVQRLLEQEWRMRARPGESPTPAEYRARFPGVTVAPNLTTADHPPSAPTPAEAPRIPGYEVLGMIARGGMGVVYKARQVSLNRPVALKLILAGAHADEEQQARFRIEAEAVAQVQHPNVVQIYEVGAHEGVSFLSLEFVDGGSLAQRLNGAAQPPRDAARLIETLARALHAVHQRGIIHRDLKPANVLLTADGTPKVTDFGLAKRLEGEEGQTRTGDILGTPSYMAPEQAAGVAEAVGPQTDVWALGAILYELFTGRPPFRGPTALETVYQVRTQEPVPPRRLQPKLHRDLETICLKALAKDPWRRYASALELADDLARWGAGDAILARPEGRLARLWRKVRRRPLVPVAAALVLLAVAAGTLAWMSSRGVREEGLSLSHRAELRGKLEAGMKAAAWPAGHEREMDGLLAELQRLDDPEHAELARRVNQRFAEVIDGAIGQARLAPADIAAIKESLGRLAVRAPARATTLRKTLDRRLTEWDTVFELKAPFANPQAVFEQAPLRVEAGALVLQVRDKKAPAPTPTLLTRYPCEGNVRLEAELDVASGSFAEVGLLFNASPTHAPLLNALAFSPDGALLAGAGRDGTVTLWDTTTGQPRSTFRDPAGELYCLAFRPGGRTLATGGNRWVRLWDVATGKATASWEAHQGQVWALAFAPDGKVLATGGSDKTARLWDATTGAAQGRPREHPHNVVCLTFADGGRTLGTLTDGPQRLVRREDLTTGAREECRIPTVDQWTRYAAISPDARLAACITWRPNMGLWDVPGGKPRPQLHGSYGPMTFSPDGKLLARPINSRLEVPDALAVYEVDSGRLRTTTPGHPAGVTCLAFSPDGATLASAGADGTLQLADTARGTQRLNLGGRTYAFLVSPPELLDPRSAGAAVRSAGRARLQILRNGVSQRVVGVTLPVRSPTLRLRATRENNVLTFQVNDLPPLTFHDLLVGGGSSAGVFGVHAVGETRLLALRAFHQPRPAERSPLEQGDELYERGDFAGALAFFQQQAHRPGAAEVGREARCKVARCLLQLNRAGEADRLLEEVAADPAGGRWPLVAGYQLLLLRVDQGRLDADTDALVESLGERYKAAEVAEVIPEDVRQQILKACDVPPLDYLFFREAHLQKLQRASAIAARLDPPLLLTLRLELQMLHAYQLLGRDKEAVATARTSLKGARGLPLSGGSAGAAHLIADACWTLRQHGERQRVLAELDQLSGPTVNPRPLLVERARVHAAQGDWAAAEKALDQSLELPTAPGQSDYTFFSAACLMKGFLCEQRGDKDGAVRFWRRGLFRTWYEGLSPAARLWVPQKNPTTVLHSLITGALANELSDAEAEQALALLTAGSANSLVGQMLKAFRLPPEALRAMWQGPRGKAYARKIAFRDLTFPEFIRAPVWLSAAEALRLGALAGPASAEQEELIWGVVQETFTAVATGKLQSTQFLQVGLAWKGSVGQFGWAGVSGKLARSLRGPLAYILGHRYQRLNRPADAAMFFRTALADAAPGSPLQRLARAEVERSKKL